MTNKEIFSLTKEDGTLKTKEEFTKEMGDFYDAAATSKDLGSQDLFRTCINPMTQINPEEAFKTYDFINRIVRINGDITMEIAQTIMTYINFWNGIDSFEETPSEERMLIQILINTDGGDLIAAFTIINSIEISQTPVVTWNCGRA